MKITKNQWLIIAFTATYILAFAFYYISIKNYEFLWYVAVTIFFAVLIASTLEKTKFDSFVLWGLSIWGFLHMAGGGIKVNGAVLYRYIIFNFINLSEDFVILKFDQFVHFYGFAIATLAIFYLLIPSLKSRPTKSIYFIAAIAGMGLGALNEIVEFIAVVIFPETGVGGYYNTSLDLVFNSIGAVTGIFVAYLRNK